jgi:hypothetical protein
MAPCTQAVLYLPTTITTSVSGNSGNPGSGGMRRYEMLLLVGAHVCDEFGGTDDHT